MSLLESIRGKFLGNKSAKDIKQLMPIVNIILDEYAKLASLSNDQLRDKTQELNEISNCFKASSSRK